MRLFYTLITSGLLIFIDFPADYSPPHLLDVPIDDSHQWAAAPEQLNSWIVHPDMAFSGTAFTGTAFGLGTLSMEQQGKLYYASLPPSFLALSPDHLPIQGEIDTLEAKPFNIESARQQDGSEPMGVDTKPSPTPLPALDGGAATPNTVTNRQQSQLPISGYAMYYNPNVMQEVVSNRLAMGHISSCAECVGTVALLRPGDLNRRVWLQWADGVVEGPFLVVDVAAAHHVAQLLARNWVVDVDNRTAVRRGMRGPVWVTVWGAPPPANPQSTVPFAPLYASAPPTGTPLLQAAPPAATPTATPLPYATATPEPTPNTAPIANGSLLYSGFPPDTPTPTITPLPALIPLSLAPAITPSPANTPYLVASPIVAATVGFPSVTAAPTNTPLPALPATPTATMTTAPWPTATVKQHAFPPDTPVPTVTPLPAIN